MHLRRNLFVLTGFLLLSPGEGFAAPVIGTIAPNYTTTSPQPSNITAVGGFFDGVGDFLTNIGTRCSSGLLNDGLHVLTAAHCVTNNSGVQDVTAGTVRFDGDLGSYIYGVDEIYIHTGWTGSLGDGSDIAVLRLNDVVDSEITRYDIYRDTDEVGQVGDKAGFGRSGDGLTGSVLNSGTKRNVQNRYDIAGLPLFGGISTDILLYDFDNGNPDNDAIGRLVPSTGLLTPFMIDPIGVGINEGISAPGDSGGPTFLNNMIAGVTSFGFTYNFIDGSSPDIDGGGAPNSTFGEIAGDTRVSSFTSFIDSFIVVPVPVGVILLSTGLIGLFGVRRIKAA